MARGGSGGWEPHAWHTPQHTTYQGAVSVFFGFGSPIWNEYCRDCKGTAPAERLAWPEARAVSLAAALARFAALRLPTPSPKPTSVVQSRVLRRLDPVRNVVDVLFPSEEAEAAPLCTARLCPPPTHVHTPVWPSYVRGRPAQAC